MDLKSLKIDSAKLELGTWIEKIPDMGDLALKVRGLGSARYRAEMQRRIRALSRADKDRDGSPKPDVLDRIRGEALAEAVLLDWRGITDNGAPLAFSKAAANAMLTDADFAPFRDAVVWAASLVGTETAEDEAAVLGNSSPGSAGS